MSVDENKIMATLYIDGMHNKKRVDVLDEYSTDNCVIHIGQETFNREEYKELVRRYFTAFPDVCTIIEDQFGEDNNVATRWTTRFTHTGYFMGVPPTYKSISFSGISIYHFSEGKIIEIWISWDRLALMQQLGIIPSIT